MIKVLYLPLGDQPGMVDAFRNVGAQLDVYDFYGMWERTHSKGSVSSEFLARVEKLKPDLIHMQLQFTGLLDASVIAEARRICPDVVITNWSGDVRDIAIPHFTNVSGAVNYSLISSTGQLEMYRNAGCANATYWQIGYNPKVSYPLNQTEFKYEVSFLANNYGNVFPDGNLRMGVADTLRGTFGNNFGLFGSGYSPPAQSVEPSRSNVIYNDSKCVLSISNFNNISHYFSDRLLICMASGRPTISWHFPGFESYFVEGQDILIARSAKDVVDAVHFCRENPDVAKQIGINGYNRVLKEHTFTSRVIELLHITKLIHMV